MSVAWTYAGDFRDSNAISAQPEIGEIYGIREGPVWTECFTISAIYNTGFIYAAFGANAFFEITDVISPPELGTTYEQEGSFLTYLNMYVHTGSRCVVCGTTKLEDDTPVAGVEIQGDTIQSGNSNEYGRYWTEVTYNFTGNLTPSKTNYSFTPEYTGYTNLITHVVDDYVARSLLPDKPTNPSPAHEETGVVWGVTPESYDASTPEPADTYDIYFGVKGINLVKIVYAQDVLEWRTPYVILNIKDYNPAVGEGYRSPQIGDIIYDETDVYIITYVIVGNLINVQYQAKLYAFRVYGPGNKNRGDILTNGVVPDVESPQAVRITLNDQWHFRGNVEEIYLPPNTTFQWRVDATNEYGTTTGDTWEFTTQALRYTQTSYRPISDGSEFESWAREWPGDGDWPGPGPWPGDGNWPGPGSGPGPGPEFGPYDYPSGIQGIDWEWTGENCVIAIKRLIAAANNKIWYEDI